VVDVISGNDVCNWLSCTFMFPRSLLPRRSNSPSISVLHMEPGPTDMM